MNGEQRNGRPDLHGRHAAVTGGAGGIGYETSRVLALAGADVLILDLNHDAGANAVARIRGERADARVRFAPLDLGDLAAVSRLGQQLCEAGQPLDLLFNNAGIQPLSRRATTVNGFELTFGIGHLGHFALTGHLLPLLRRAPAARVVTTSSLVHRHGGFILDDLQLERHYEAQRAYNQTKLANLLFARELQRRAERAGLALTSLAAHPGVARTGIGSNRRRQGRLGWRDHLVTLMLGLVMPLLGQDARAGAQPLLHAATASDVEPGGFYGPSGFGEMKGAPAPARIAPSGRDEALATWLWETSARLCDLNYLEPTGRSSSEPALA